MNDLFELFFVPSARRRSHHSKLPHNKNDSLTDLQPSVDSFPSNFVTLEKQVYYLTHII